MANEKKTTQTSDKKSEKKVEKLTLASLEKQLKTLANIEAEAIALPLTEAIIVHRKYEEQITDFSKKIHPEDLTTLKAFLDNAKHSDMTRFACFFVLFTYYRKNGYEDSMQTIVDTYLSEFVSHYLSGHIRLMCKVKRAPIEDYDDILSTLENGDYDKYDGFMGYMNQYVEICARYYEIHLDKRKERINSNDDNSPLDWCRYLKKARAFAERCCNENNPQANYAKLHVNRGRIYALMGEYGNAERAIAKGISLVSATDPHYSITLASFNNHYENIPSIASYDITAIKLEEKAKEITETAKKKLNELKEENEKLIEKQQKEAKDEIDKLKSENLRNVSIITAAFSLIIGGIQAFEHLDDVSKIGRVFGMYASLFFVAIGAICLITHLFTRREACYKKIAIIVSAVVCIVALVAFLLCTILP